MDLNQDLPESIDPELVPPPGTLNQQEGELDLIANTRANPDPDKGLPPEIIQDLPNLNIAFKSVTDAGSVIISLQDVEEQILGDDGMSKASAETIERVVGNFYEQVGDESKFTETPSGIGMESTTNFIQNVRLEAKRTMVLEFKSLIEKPLARALEDLALVKEKFEPHCREVCEGLRNSLLNHDKPFYDSNNVIFAVETKQEDGAGIKTEFVNIFTTDLTVLVSTLTASGNVDLLPYLASVKAVQAILCNTGIKSFIKCFNETGDFAKSVSRTAVIDYRDQPFALKDLVDFYANEACCEAIRTATGLLEAKIELFEEIRAQSAEFMENGTMDEFITRRTPDIMDFLHSVSMYFMFTNEYLLLLNQVRGLFEISQMTIEPTEEKL